FRREGPAPLPGGVGGGASLRGRGRRRRGSGQRRLALRRGSRNTGRRHRGLWGSRCPRSGGATARRRTSGSDGLTGTDRGTGRGGDGERLEVSPRLPVSQSRSAKQRFAARHESPRPVLIAKISLAALLVAAPLTFSSGCGSVAPKGPDKITREL